MARLVHRFHDQDIAFEMHFSYIVNAIYVTNIIQCVAMEREEEKENRNLEGNKISDRNKVEI